MSNNSTLYLAKRAEKGELTNLYAPFQNLVDNNKIIGKFTTDNLNFDLEHPVDIITQESYDGAVNLIINDDKNPSRIINSRFSVQNDTTYLIPEHYGFKDTNVYEDSTFNLDTILKNVFKKIPKLKFDGLENNTGKLPCGSYSFYFKFSDVDGNESEICQESGIVTVHIGDLNDPSSDRMGLENENSGKSVKFTLTGIDQGFDYIKVLFIRVSSGESQAKSVTYHKVLYNYPIVNGICQVTITGNESIIGISQDEFYRSYADINSVKTQTVSNNVLLLGNVSKTEHDWEEIKRMSWRIIPYLKLNSSNLNKLGSLNASDYSNNLISDLDKSSNYYNAKNVYSSVGYWPGELYRLGICYIFDDNSISPVFNIQGINLMPSDAYEYDPTKSFSGNNEKYIWQFFNSDGTCRDYEPGNSELETDENSNYQDLSYFFDKSTLSNSKGVIKTRVDGFAYDLKGGTLLSTPQPIYFDFSYINCRQIDKSGQYLPQVSSGKTSANSTEQEQINRKDAKNLNLIFKKHHIIGFFFVRQKRVPTIIAQGMVIGLTDRFRGSLPVIQYAQRYSLQSFLSPTRTLNDKGTFITLQNNVVSNKAILVPDAELSEPSFNDIFVSNDYYVERIGTLSAFAGPNSSYIYPFIMTRKINKTEEGTSEVIYDPIGKVVKLTNVTEDTASATNGKDYFSTRAGNASEPYKTKDVRHAWRWSLPQQLTESTSLVRGMWGAYVGMSDNSFDFGDVVNIKKAHYQYKNADELEFRSRFTDLNPYHTISHWMNISDMENNTVECYRGDCFTTLFTHRMYRNFIDPELPTNDLIIDPSCWRANYGVRCTAEILLNAHSNMTQDAQGWYLEDPTKPLKFDWATFAVLLATGNILGALVSLKNLNRSESELAKIAGVNKLGEDVTVDNPAPAQEEQQELDTEEEALKQTLPLWALKYYPNGFANEVVQSFETHLTMKDKRQGSALKKKVNPKEQEQQGGFNLKAIFHSDDSWELHGLASINRADVNAVGLGLWITFPICSNRNYSFRDIDFSNATEEASFSRKRSFFPLQKINQHNPLRDSNVINYAAGVSIPEKGYTIFPDIPFFKLEYFTRVYCSLRDSSENFTNEYKQVFENAFRDYDKQYGSITKLVSIPNGVVVVFSHGVGLIQVSQTEADVRKFLSPITMLSTDFGSMWKDSVLFTSRGVSGDFSVYGVDTIAKKIWRYSPNGFELLSDHKVGKFLIDNIDMTEFTSKGYIGHINVKTHYNAFKHDVIFTYYNDIPYDKDGNIVKLIGKDPLKKYFTNDDDEFNQTALEVRDKIVKWENGKQWSLCYNEDTTMFTTFYDWYPMESVNIDNVFFTFDRDAINDGEDAQIWKHGQSGLYWLEKPIKPTNWYGKQHEFNFEFVVNKNAQILKIFNNLKMISNKAEPYKFEFEVVGEAYDWYGYKEILGWIYSNYKDPIDGFRDVLTNSYGDLLKNPDNKFPPNFPTLFNREDSYQIKKLPYLKVKEAEVPGTHYSERFENGTGTLYPDNSKIPANRTQIDPNGKSGSEMYKSQDSYKENSSSTMLVYDDLLNEYRVRTELFGNDIKKFGRIRGNMQYLEDLWDVEIRPTSFKWVYLTENRPKNESDILSEDNGTYLALSKSTEARLRDKYIKVKVRYSGKDLAVILAILTMFDYSFA